MPLQVLFSIEKTELVVGESPSCLLQIKNTGSEPLKIFQPLGGGGMPSFRVVSVKSGSDKVIQGSVQSGGIPSTQMLSPNQEVELTIPLLHNIKLLLPDDYLISVVYEYNNGMNRAESIPVKVKVHHMAVTNLFLDSVQGSGINGVWINPAKDPPDVMVTSFNLMMGNGVGKITPVGKAGFECRPVISLLPNTFPGFGQWVAWIREGSLEYVYHDEAIPLGRVEKFDLSSAQAEIVPPLYIKSNTDYGVRAPGDVILWMSGDSPQNSSVQLINLVPVGETVVVEPGTKFSINGGRPEWAMNHARSNGSRLITFIRAGNRNVGLNSLPLPKQGGMGTSINVSPLVDWEGDLVAAGATMDLGDVIRGAVLMWTGPKDNQKLELVGWSIDANGGTSEHYRETIPWGPTVPVGAAKVRVRENGVPAVLLRPIEPDWFVYDGEGNLKPVPGPYKETSLEMDMAFLGGTEVVLICTELTGGFSVKRMDGRGLAPRPI